MKTLRSNPPGLKHLSLPLLLLFSFVLHFSVSAQNFECTELFTNPTLEIDPNECPIGGPDKLPRLSFYHNLIPGWWNSHGSAHTKREVSPGIWTAIFSCPLLGSEKSGIATFRPTTGAGFSEGIFHHSLAFSKDPFVTYHLSARYRVTEITSGYNTPNHLIHFKLANSLVNKYDNDYSLPENIPNRQLHVQEMNSFDVVETNLDFQLLENETFDQIWIHNNEPQMVTPLQVTAFDYVSLKCSTTALTAIAANRNELEVQFSAINSSTMSDFVTYLWDFGDGNTSTEANPLHIYAEEDEYTVCLQIKDSNGCCGELCEVINVSIGHTCGSFDNCIVIGSPGSTVYLSDLLSGPNPEIPSQPAGWLFPSARLVQSTCFYLYGKLVVDTDVIFSNTHWYMDPGAEIEQSTWLLWAGNSVFQGCDYMWRGIKLPESETGKLIVLTNNTTIRDAEYGVSLNEKNKIFASNSNFINNIIGVDMYVLYSQSDIIQNHFEGNKFAFTGNMLNKYNGQFLYYLRTESGIRAFGVSLLNIAENNEFFNLTYGIKSRGSGLEIYGSSFTIDDIINEDDCYFNCGISISKSQSVSSIINNEFNNSFLSVESFDGLNDDLRIIDNTMNHTCRFPDVYLHRSIDIRRINAGKIDISKNYFNYKSEFSSINAINIENSLPRNITLEDNTFDLSFPVHCVFLSPVVNFNKVTIRYQSQSKLNYNTFNLTYAQTFLVRNSPRLQFNNNKFYGLDSSSGKGIAFSLSNSSDCRFTNNITYNDQSLFQVINSLDNTFCCNYSDGSLGGTFYYHNGGLQYSSLYANKIKHLELEHGSIIGMQPSRGNIWNPAGSSAQITEFIPNYNYIEQNQFTVDPTQLGHKPTDINPAMLADDWFRLTGISKPCDEYEECNSSIFGGYPGGGGDISGDKVSEVVDNYVRTCRYNKSGLNPFEDLSRWDNAMYMYQYQYNFPLIDWEGKIDSVSLLIGTSGYREEISQEISDWYQVQEDIINIYTLDESDMEIVDNAHDVIHQNIEYITTWHQQNPDSVVNDLKPYYQVIAGEVSKIESVNTTMKLNAYQRANSVLNALNGLSNRYPFLAEQKKVWTVEIKIIRDGANSISENEWNDMKRIALLCPLEYGSVVYNAWGLLSVHGYEMDEISIANNCSQMLQPRSDGNGNIGLGIHPNPASGKIEIEWAEADADGLRVYNSTGQEVMQMSIDRTAKKAELDMSAMQNGIYIVRLMRKNETLVSGRVVLIK